MSDEKDKAAPAIGVSYQIQLSPTRTLVFQAHVPMEAKLTGLNAVTDLLRLAAERQEDYAMIPVLEKLVEAADRELQQTNTALGIHDSQVERKQAEFKANGRRGDYKGSDTDLMNRQRLEQQAEHFVGNRANAIKELDKLRAKLDGRPYDLSNSDTGG